MQRLKKIYNQKEFKERIEALSKYEKLHRPKWWNGAEYQFHYQAAKSSDIIYIVHLDYLNTFLSNLSKTISKCRKRKKRIAFLKYNYEKKSREILPRKL